ncbi:O-methyltransferase [Allorhizocola rhizosphaerae]|uniref:O-methyltransferase n=1 Tax=Allorhizocola rhizosphaerae TaxID=1872709 RepID=UPI001FE8AFBD|nr:class I SAM-dependent methyltransferase [Allorhizocola rhizosphaerae]
MSQALRGYLLRSCTPPDEVVQSLIAYTAAAGDQAGMMVPFEQASLLTMLARLARATVAVDVGTFTGLSALALARGLPAGGRVITCDVTDAWLGIAHEHWQRAAVADRIEFRLGPARRVLGELGGEPVADIVFIDADKMNYPRYCELAVPLLRPGGLLILDNVLLDGYVIDPELADDGLMRSCARVMREVNLALAADERLDTVMLPIADGVTLARRR